MKHIKKLLPLFVILIIMSSFSLTATAADVSTHLQAEAYCEHQAISPLQEITTVYTRINNGVLEYRIWSNTFLRWNTPWRPVFP